MRLPEVRADEPFRTGERVEEELLGGVVLVDGPPVVLADELEEAGALVLPDGGVAVAVDEDLVAGRCAAELGEERARPWIAHVVHLLALLVTHEAARVAEAPGGTGRLFRARSRAALVGLALHADVISVGGFTHMELLLVVRNTVLPAYKANGFVQRKSAI